MDNEGEKLTASKTQTERIKSFFVVVMDSTFNKKKRCSFVHSLSRDMTVL